MWNTHEPYGTRSHEMITIEKNEEIDPKLFTLMKKYLAGEITEDEYISLMKKAKELNDAVDTPTTSKKLLLG